MTEQTLRAAILDAIDRAITGEAPSGYVMVPNEAFEALRTALNEPPASQKSAAPIAQEPPEPGVCAMCGHAFSIPDGLEPTDVCNTCAQEFYATHAAPQVAQEPVAPEHVAWCRYIRSSSDRPTRIALCDSDADGAFKVYRAAPIAAPAGTQFGWLIENGKQAGSGLAYRFIDNAAGGICGWTDDHNKALRFARREDAEQFAHHDEDAWRIVEHGWAASPTAPDRKKGET